MGSALGVSVGDILGIFVGVTLGIKLGISEGISVGDTEGANVLLRTRSVSLSTISSEGDLVGPSVGISDGL